jgi:hypothetical protein
MLRAEILKRWPDAVLPDGPPVTNIFSAVDKAVRKWAPADLRAEGLEEHACKLEQLPEIVDDETASGAAWAARVASPSAPRAAWAAYRAASRAAYWAESWAASEAAFWVIQAAPSLEAAIELLAARPQVARCTPLNLHLCEGSHAPTCS